MGGRLTSREFRRQEATTSRKQARLSPLSPTQCTLKSRLAIDLLITFS
jgi:hypothetical protein